MYLGRTLFRKILYLFLLLLLNSNLFLHSQDKRISGYIFDSKTNETLPFANIVLGNNISGTVSNADGYFVMVIDSLHRSEFVSFNYVGYHSLNIPIDQLNTNSNIKLKPATINIKEVEVSAKELSIKQILKQVTENYEENHLKETSTEQKVFVHNLEKIPIKGNNQVKVKRADFEEFDENTIEELKALLPNDNIDYNDAVLMIYNNDSHHKIVPIEAITLEEGGLENLEEDLKNLFEPFINRIRTDALNEDVIYKVKSGIIGGKLDLNDTDTVRNSDSENKDYNDKKSESVYDNIASLIKEFSDIENKDLDFINAPGKYNYTKNLSLINDELAYKIHFEPKINGTYSGDIYISRDDFGILQLDYKYGEGKRGKHFHLLGIGYTEKFKQAHVIFNKDETGYYIKYINAQKNDILTLERKLSFIKKENRRIINKQVNEIKLDLDLTFNSSGSYEYLVLNRKSLTPEEFKSIKGQDTIHYKREFVYSPEMWKKPTIIAPSAELQKYQRKK